MILIFGKPVGSHGDRRRQGMLAGALILLGVMADSCGGDPSSGRPLVVATTTIWGDVVSGVVGDAGEVAVLMPVGTDAHDFRPSSRQLAVIAGADLVVANGLQLEPGLAAALESAAAEGTPVLELAAILDPLPLATDELGAPIDGGLDPHVWMDPVRVAEAARILGGELERLLPGDGWEPRAESYSRSLLAAHGEMEEILADVPQAARKLVTNHEALGYFAARYGFEVVGVVIPGGSTLAEPSSAEVAALVEVMEEQGVTAIFAETVAPTALAEAVAAEAGEEVEVVELYTESLGPPGSGADTLAGMLVTDATLVAEALR